MKSRILLFLPLLGFLGLSFFFYQGLSMDPSARDSPLLAQPFPTFNLTTLENPSRRVNESLFEGQVTLVNVWGEWCPTCKHEMPQLLDLVTRGVRLVGINYKDTQAKGLEFLEEFGNPFEVNIFDPEGNLGFELGVYGAPESFVVDTEGTIRYKHTGYITPEDVERVIQEIEKWQR
ncbi:cytochrome c biogenesis protein CcmG, thiol:disulfide interchange protein DsbE [Vreelandella subterranea]|uniref:Cytochrome c biogenesis protein CcmG, thiol:disulfide interchange protein DsbE n=1 Tax=Vreelandella subterranea TaxID=416874 RepID=A0A1H9REJ3_9GAMM|nr:DsbE family thiol:disulfide interchange protein [Halomonas subterranea]SER71122.1 cytochrome c biogenesis protein CcmG, thiol:disulfide interchange protein DsbE [Halomonas subterranea]